MATAFHTLPKTGGSLDQDYKDIAVFQFISITSDSKSKKPQPSGVGLIRHLGQIKHGRPRNKNNSQK